MAATPPVAPDEPVRDAARVWNPNGCWFVPLVVGAWAYVAAWLPAWGAISAWVLLPVGAVTALAGVLLARVRYPVEVYGDRQYRLATWFAGGAGVALTVWLLLAAVNGPTNGRLLVSLLCGMVVFGLLYALIDRHAFGSGELVQQQEQIRVEAQTQSIYEAWEQILHRAGFPGMRAISKEDTPGGYAVGVMMNLDKPATVAELRAASKRIAVVAAGVLAQFGVMLQENDVKVEQAGAAHVALLYVTTKKFMAESVVYQPTPGDPSCNDPRTVGTYETGDPVRFSLADTHAGEVGATGSGKSVLANVLIGRFTECVDALGWVAATDKLVPLVYPWLRPWFDGRMGRPVLDWVAGQEPQQVLQMLADAYNIMRARNARNSNISKMSASVEDPAIKIFIEESADALRRADTIRLSDGRELHASALVYEITRAGRSACVTVELFSQFALMDALGRFGSEISRNTTRRIALRTMTTYDGNATLVGLDYVDTTKLRDNTMMVQDSIEEPRCTVAKSQYLEGDLVHEVAIRNGARRTVLGADDVAACQYYHGRWSADRLPELVSAARRDGFNWPGKEVAPPAPRIATEIPPANQPQRTGRAVADLDIDAEFAAITNELEPKVQTATDIPNVDAEIQALTNLQARVDTPAYRMLTQIMSALSRDGAPKEFVPTRELVVVLGRIAANADSSDIDQAANKLGQELASLVPNLTTTRKRVDGKPTRGYFVARLRQAHLSIARGEALPPETSD